MPLPLLPSTNCPETIEGPSSVSAGQELTIDLAPPTGFEPVLPP